MENIDFSRMSLSLALVIGLIWLTAYLLKRTGFDKRLSGVRGTAAGRLQVADALYLDTKRKLVLVRADTNEYLILINGDTTTVIDQLAPKKDSANAS